MSICEDCGIEISRRSRWCRKCHGKHHSEKIKGKKKPEGFGAKISKARFNKPSPKNWGELHSRWNGGGGKWRGFAWIIQRRAALKRDKYRCCGCGKSQG